MEGEAHLTWNRAVRDVLLGMNDGLIETLSLVAGLTGAIAESRLILIAGLAGMLAGTVSMFTSAYVGMKSQQEFFEKELERERREVDEVPEMEREELRYIYRRKGFEGAELEMVVARLTENKDRWVRSMMEEELQLFPERFERPLLAAGLTGGAFLAGAIVPLSSFLVLPPVAALQTAVIASGALLFIVGAGKARLTTGRWVRSGLKMAAFGLTASLLCYLIGTVSGRLLLGP